MLSSDATTAVISAATLAYRNKEFEKALVLAQKGDKNLKGIEIQVLCFLQLNAPEKALKIVTEMIKLDPNYPTVKFYLL